MVQGPLVTTVPEALDRFRHQPSPPEGSTGNPFRLVSTLASPARAGEVEEAWGGSELLSDAVELWMACREARLFEDVDYGQWGLALLTPAASAARTAQEREARPLDYRPGDLVIGEFLGDQELVVLAPSETGQRRVLIALPLDTRVHWPAAAASLGEFLATYFEAAGAKYWERRNTDATH
jgi:hypothetical protein